MSVLLAFLLIAAVILISGFRVAQQYERALVFRFGRHIALQGSGLCSGSFRWASTVR